jgi:hypothetical protein
MANCNEHFQDYNDEIKLTDARRKSLKRSRKELRNKVRKWFKENKPNEIQPKFNGQGSFPMDTIINPLPRTVTENGQEVTKLYYDVDDGIYFEGNDDVENRHSATTYHNWIYDAVKGHTSTDPIDKDTCVRTIFSDGHNIDQPVYYKQGDVPELAHKKKGYIVSDPKAFMDWFNDKAEEQPQLRLLTRYGKGWCDLKDFENPGKQMPCGLIITILIAENAVYRTDRDDIAIKETLINIQSTLQKNFVCYRPTAPAGENLLNGYKYKDYFMQCLSDFIDDSKKALQEKNIRKSTELWRKHLSNRFPLGEDKDDTSSSSAGLASIIPSTTRPYAE